jgi:hypothetical protein
MERTKNGAQTTGEIVSVHPSQDKYGGCFGEISGRDGRTYVFSGSNMFRNGSHPEVGGKVLFTVAEYSYATDIDRTDKVPSRAPDQPVKASADQRGIREVQNWRDVRLRCGIGHEYRGRVRLVRRRSHDMDGEELWSDPPENDFDPRTCVVCGLLTWAVVPVDAEVDQA